MAVPSILFCCATRGNPQSRGSGSDPSWRRWPQHQQSGNGEQPAPINILPRDISGCRSKPGGLVKNDHNNNKKALSCKNNPPTTCLLAFYIAKIWSWNQQLILVQKNTVLLKKNAPRLLLPICLFISTTQEHSIFAPAAREVGGRGTPKATQWSPEVCSSWLRGKSCVA